MLGKVLNPKNDLVFKKVFGSEKNKDILLHFLNDMLGDVIDAAITEVTLLNTNQQADIQIGKQSILDVLCVDDKGVQFIVEMQVASTGGFVKRAQYYAAKAYSSQLAEGDSYSGLKEVIFLAILDFVMLHDRTNFKSDHVILNKETYDHDLKDFSFTFIELPKFKKEKIADLLNNVEKWCYFFKHATDPDDMEELLKNGPAIITRAYNELSAFSWSKEELLAYERREKARLDNLNYDLNLQEEARQEGMEKGIEVGMEKGIEVGMEKGASQAKIDMAKTLLSLNVDIAVIEKSTGISAHQLQKILDT